MDVLSIVKTQSEQINKLQTSVDRLMPRVKEPQDDKESSATKSEEEKNSVKEHDVEEVEESKQEFMSLAAAVSGLDQFNSAIDKATPTGPAYQGLAATGQKAEVRTAKEMRIKFLDHMQVDQVQRQIEEFSVVGADESKKGNGIQLKVLIDGKFANVGDY